MCYFTTVAVTGAGWLFKPALGPWLIRQTGPHQTRYVFVYLATAVLSRGKRNSQTDSRLSDKMFETLLLLKANALYKH